MKKIIILSLTAVCFCVVSQAQVFPPRDRDPLPFPNMPTPVDPLTICVVPKIDGEKVPFPLKNANTKYELAENETYLLNGTIVQLDRQMYFKVDFDSQPYLATTKRTQFPYFLIDSTDTSIMKKFDGSLVQMAVIVRDKKISGDPKESNQNLVLDIIAPPIPIRK